MNDLRKAIKEMLEEYGVPSSYLENEINKWMELFEFYKEEKEKV